MKIKYKILSINHNEHSIEVRYYTDTLTEEFLAVDSNKREDGTPTRCRLDYNITLYKYPIEWEEIEQTIKDNAPIQWIQLLTNETSLSHIEHLVGKEQNVDIDTNPKKLLTEEEIENLLKSL